MIKYALLMSIVLIEVITSTAQAQNKVVVIPLFGDDAASQLPPAIPSGTNLGDILYWDGSVWQLTPAPPVAAGGLTVLNLNAGVPTWTTTYGIGDTGPAGGIVFYITSGGLHGLEAAPTDSANSSWGCAGPFLGTDIPIGTGAQNTVDIVAGCATAGIAAKVANDFTLNGFSDWFLPSKDELNQLYLHQGVVGGFASRLYWSSSESDGNNAWSLNFDRGSQSGFGKPNAVGVRPVRAF